MSDKETKAEKEQLINNLVSAIDNTYHKAGNLMWRSFLSGLLSGLGATIGVAIVITLLGFLIRKLGGIPVLGDWLNALGTVLPAHK